MVPVDRKERGVRWTTVEVAVLDADGCTGVVAVAEVCTALGEESWDPMVGTLLPVAAAVAAGCPDVRG